MRYQQALLLPVFAGVLCAGCRKEQANGAPGITILQPAEFASVALPDTLMVTVQAQDDHGLVQVAVTLLDANGIPVVATASASASGTSATRTIALPIVSEQLESGPYKLLATAYDGELAGKDYRSIHISAVPLRVRMVFTLAAPQPGTVDLYRTDSTGQTVLAASFSMDLGGAAVSSLAQRLYVAGAATGPMWALLPDQLGTAWQLPNLSSIGAPWFTSVDLCADGRVYVGQDDGTLRGYTAANGTGGSVAHLSPGFRATRCATVGDLLVSTQRHFVTQENRLGIHFRLSGSLVQEQPLDVDPVGLYVRDAEHVLVFGNRNGQGRLLDRTLVGGGTWEAYVWPQPISAVAAVGSQSWLVALADGGLQRFTYGGSGAVPLGSTPVLSTLAFDAVNGWVYGGTGFQVLRIDPGSGATEPAWTVNGPVLRVLPLLNR